MDAHGELLVAVAERAPGIRHVLLSPGQSTNLIPVVAPEPLTSSLGNWTSACAAGEHLFVEGSVGRIGHYDLSTHRWEAIPLPVDGVRPRQLEATSAGLWLITENGDLWLWDLDRRFWLEPPICSHVESVFGEAEGLAVLMRPPEGARETARLTWVTDQDARDVLIGRSLEGPLQTVTAVAEFRGMLFLGSFSGWHQYDPHAHEWQTFPFEQTSSVRTFASTGDFLYGLVAREGDRVGTLYRFDPENRTLDPVLDSEQRLAQIELDFITADGSRTVAFLGKDQGIVVIRDEEPDELQMLFPCSSSELSDCNVRC